MTIEQIDEKRIIIALCKKDMEVLSLEYETMGFKDPYSRRILKNLLSLAGKRTGMAVHNHTLMVEALPYDKGCIIMVTLVNDKTKRKRYRIKNSDKILKNKNIMYVFENSENFLTSAMHLYKCGTLLMGSKAFELDKKYYLIVKSKECPLKSLTILREYACKEIKSKLKIAYVKEHGNTVADSHAILRIGSAMCNY